MVKSGLVPELRGEVGFDLLKDASIGGRVATDPSALDFVEAVARVPDPLVVDARNPSRLGNPMYSPRDGAVGVDV